MKELLKFLKNYKIQCFLAPLFKMLEASFELSVPLVIARLFDNGIKTGNKDVIIECFILLIILAVLGFISACVAQYFAAYAATGFSKELRESLFKHLFSLSFKEIDNIGTSTMITRMTLDSNQVQTGVNMFLRLFLRSPFVVFGAMIMAFTIDFKAALIFVAVIIILLIVVLCLMLNNIPLLKKVQGGIDRLLLLTRENLTGVRVIRAFCKEDEEVENFKKSNNDLVIYQRKSGLLSGSLNPLTYIIVNLAICCLIKQGGDSVLSGVLTTGQVIALYNYMAQILVELVKLANLIITLNKSLASADRLSDVFNIKSSMQDGSEDIPDNSDKIVEFKNVSFKYNESGDNALENISFSVNKGEIIGIIGGTGSGKSTLVSLIMRFYDVNDGEVLVKGKNVKKLKLESLRKICGFVPQKAALFKGTITDNLNFGNKEINEDKINNAVLSAVSDDIVKSKGGLLSEIKLGAKNLSGGQKQRLTVARALVKEPEILILDDSASALDYITEKTLNENIRKLPYKPTTFIVTQRASSVINADRIIVLEDGEIAGCGTNEELLKTCDVYREIYNTQFEEKQEK